MDEMTTEEQGVEEQATQPELNETQTLMVLTQAEAEALDACMRAVRGRQMACFSNWKDDGVPFYTEELCEFAYAVDHAIRREMDLPLLHELRSVLRDGIKWAHMEGDEVATGFIKNTIAMESEEKLAQAMDYMYAEDDYLPSWSGEEPDEGDSFGGMQVRRWDEDNPYED